MVSNKQKITGTIAAVVASASIATGSIGLMNSKKVEIPYRVNVVNQYVSELDIDIPEEASVDLMVLYINENKIAQALKPDGTLKAIPLIFSDLDNVTVECQNHGRIIGECVFDNENNKCYYIEK